MEVAVLGVLPALPSLECRAVCTAMPTPLNYADGLMQRSQLVAARSEAERPVQAAYLVQAQHGQQQAGDNQSQWDGCEGAHRPQTPYYPTQGQGRRWVHFWLAGQAMPAMAHSPPLPHITPVGGHVQVEQLTRS